MTTEDLPKHQQEKLEPRIGPAYEADLARHRLTDLPNALGMLAVRAEARTADQLTDLTVAAERIANALEGLLLVLDTRGEVSTYLLRRQGDDR